MFFSITTLCLGLLASTIIASPTPSSEPLEKRGGTFAITGITGTGTQPRLEIRNLKKNADQWNLYLLTLQAWKAQPQTSATSYYGVAGIHGVPNQPWDGVGWNPNAQGAVGYCTHSSILFPTWHRAYMTLFEQQFYSVMQGVVNSFPAGTKRTKYAKAASKFRVPYWDWAAAPPKGQPTLPSFLTAQTVSVVTPSGQKSIQNPLFGYNFAPLDSNNFYYAPWNAWQSTRRWPTSEDPSASNQENLATQAVENNRLNLRDNVYNLFTQCSQYAEFSHDSASASDSGCHNSLESIHDSIHSLIGGNNKGHMTYLWYAAFDPIFWLHHANVDRLFAMWQTIYPNTYTSAETATGTSFTIAVGDVEDENSPLTPFHKDTNGNFFSSNDVRDWTTLKYTYPEFTGGKSASTVMSYVNKLYGPQASATANSIKVKKAKRDIFTREIAPNDTVLAPPVSLISTPSGARYQYTANIATQRFALDGSYNIFVFLGNFSANAATWPFDQSLVGSYGIFSTTGMTGMSGNHSVSGTVPLTRALTNQVAAGNLADLSVENVARYLQENMQWRIASSEGVEIPAANVPGLQVSVVTANATLSADPSQFPVFGEWATLPVVTAGRAGGLQEDDRLAFDVAREERRASGLVGR